MLAFSILTAPQQQIESWWDEISYHSPTAVKEELNSA
jgi:hypothetical protein